MAVVLQFEFLGHVGGILASWRNAKPRSGKLSGWEGGMLWNKRDIWMRMEVFVAVAVVLVFVVSQLFK
jgi:hypothetical protein